MWTTNEIMIYEDKNTNLQNTNKTDNTTNNQHRPSNISKANTLTQTRQILPHRPTRTNDNITLQPLLATHTNNPENALDKLPPSLMRWDSDLESDDNTQDYLPHTHPSTTRPSIPSSQSAHCQALRIHTANQEWTPTVDHGIQQKITSAEATLPTRRQKFSSKRGLRQHPMSLAHLALCTIPL